MTREDRESDIADYVDYLDTLYAEIFSRIQREDVTVTVLGFSQGGTTAYRWLTRGRAHADRLVMWGSQLPPEADLTEAAAFFRDVKLTIVYGNRDQYAEEATITKYENSLREKDVPYELITFNGGHRLDRATLRGLTG
jgi:dienelactone hydrolase